MDVRAYEASDGPPVLDLAYAALGAIRSALQLLAAITASYQSERAGGAPLTVEPSPDDANALYRELDTRALSSHAAEDVVDVAMVGAMALRGREVAIERVLGGDPTRWNAVVVVGGAVRALRKALGAVDRAIAEVDGGQPSVLHLSELSISLLVRSAYANLVRRVSALGVPTAETARHRLRSAGNILAVFVGADAYPHLRALDRALLREMQQRIRAHLTATDAGGAEGLRLWQDLENLLDLLLSVNMREELMAHDARVISAALRDLGDDGGAEPSEAVRKSLAVVIGRDRRLDALVQAGNSPANAEDLRGALTRVLAQLDAKRDRTAARETQQARAARRLSVLPPGEDYF